ncbi:hypothetical protein P3T20_004712 [Paraburkholderia sp. GAS206C]|jgi:hypothetical protein
MRSRFHRLVATFLIVSALVSTTAQATFVRPAVPSMSALVCTTAPKFYYINGIMAPDAETEGTEAQILAMALAAEGIGHYNEVESIYNPSEGLFLDIGRKLLAQKVAEGLSGLLSFMENAFNFMLGNSSTLTAADQTNIQNSLAAATANAVTNGLDSAAAQTLKTATDTVINQAAIGIKVVLVAHSEGNMFAQALYAETQIQGANVYNPSGFNIAQQFQVVNVATPAARADTGKYVTASQDIVINLAARALALVTGTLQPATANWDAGPNIYASDPIGHSFVKVYLNKSLNGLEGQVLTLATQAASAAQSFGQENPEGPMQIVATTGAGTASYTVTAPDGSTTTTPLGNGANMTVFKPSCSDLKEGTYSVTANIVSVQQGPVFGVDTELSVPVLNVSGTNAGNQFIDFWSSPSPISDQGTVMDIEVSKDESSGGFNEQFFIYSRQ